MVGIPPLPQTGPLRPSDVKAAIFGRSGKGGLRFDRILVAGWELRPSIGIVAKDIFKLGLDIQHYKEPLTRAVLEIMIPSILKNFLMEGRPEEWERLAKFTEVRRGGKARPILYRTGMLEKTASSFRIWSIGDKSATIKKLPPHAWYGALHQEGYGSIGQIARKELGAGATDEEIQERAMQLFMGARPAHQQTKVIIPQREFILFQEEDIEDIQALFADWMEGLADKVGRGWTK